MSFNECYFCGISGQKVRLSEVISLKEKGVIRVCDNCSKRENLPVLKRPTTFQLKESEKKEPRFYERVSSERKFKMTNSFEKEERERVERDLRNIADRNYEKKISSPEKRPRPDLVDNFHWFIMMGRRAKRISREQLARELSESVAAIKMAEQGILPEDDHTLVKKLESFLGIKITRGDVKSQEYLKPTESQQSQPARVIKFDPTIMKNLTISDLKKIKEKREMVEDFSEISDLDTDNSNTEKEESTDDMKQQSF